MLFLFVCAYSGVQHVSSICIAQRVCYMRQELITLSEQLGSPQFLVGPVIFLVFLVCGGFFCVFFLFSPVSCVSNVVIVSGLSVLYCPCGFSLTFTYCLYVYHRLSLKAKIYIGCVCYSAYAALYCVRQNRDASSFLLLSFICDKHSSLLSLCSCLCDKGSWTVDSLKKNPDHLVRKDMDVIEHEIISKSTLRHKLK